MSPMTLNSILLLVALFHREQTLQLLLVIMATHFKAHFVGEIAVRSILQL